MFQQFIINLYNQFKPLYKNMEKNKVFIGSANQNHVQAYLQYCQLAGDNGGKIMSPQQFQQYQKNYPQMLANRLYTTWYNSTGLACKIVGPSTKCFCDHLYKAHDYLQAKNGKLKCKNAGCKCSDYLYIPIHGSQDFKCSCKHSYQNHDLTKKLCKNCPCKGFQSTWVCPCGQKYSSHKTISQKKEVKQQKGESVNPNNGGITSFSSMLTGADRFGHNITQEVKKKGIKVQIQEFSIPKELILHQQVSALQLSKTPLKWIK